MKRLLTKLVIGLLALFLFVAMTLAVWIAATGLRHPNGADDGCSGASSSRLENQA